MTEAIENVQASAAHDTLAAWQDTELPVADRVTDLMERMRLEEKVHQLAGFWAAPSGAQSGNVAPMQSDFGDTTVPFEHAIDEGLGQLTRVFGTEPVSPEAGVRRLEDLQAQVAGANRFGVPAMAHEECLTGFTALGATIFPCPLAWGASFDPDLVQRVAAAIGASLRRVGVHQGLAPVLDVTRDYRWGRTEETIGEDPYLVGMVGAAYTRGLESAGLVATLKHFAGYSTSRAGRNLAPAALGPRELADVVIEPFVLALRDGGARSVMQSYADVDGIPSAADDSLLTGLLRDELGFSGTVVADYFAISFLESLHGVAGSPGEAGALALHAGVDVELPMVRCFGDALIEKVRAGVVPESQVDRAVARVLVQKGELGLLDPGWHEELAARRSRNGRVDLDPPEHRVLARELAEESVVVLANSGVLPLGPDVRELAVVGPHAHDAAGMLGCYSFPRHMASKYPDLPLGVTVPTLSDGLRDELPGTSLRVLAGCGVDDPHPGHAEDGTGIGAAAEVAREAEACVLALGDRAGVFGTGTSGEGCDRETLELPGRQAELAEAVLATGTPTVLVLLSGRPYALGDLADRCAAVVQSFFPGEEGGTAVAGVLGGSVAPSGRLPVSVPRSGGGQPGTYLHSRLGARTDVSSVDPTPLYPFGHGLTWTEFSYLDLSVHADDGTAACVPTDGQVRIRARVRNAGRHAGTEVVQLYLSDPVASVVRPVRQLAGWARVALEPGDSATVEFAVHADRTSFTGPDLQRIVEPGEIEVAVGASSGDLPLRASFTLAGPRRVLTPDRVLTVPVEITS